MRLHLTPVSLMRSTFTNVTTPSSVVAFGCIIYTCLFVLDGTCATSIAVCSLTVSLPKYTIY